MKTKKAKDLIEGDIFIFDKRLYLFERFVYEDGVSYPVVKASMYINRHEYKSRFFELNIGGGTVFTDLVRFIYIGSDYEVGVMDFNFDIEFAYYVDSHSCG